VRDVPCHALLGDENALIDELLVPRPLYKLWFYQLNKDIKMITNKRPIWVWIAAIITVVFGIVTIKSGGSVIFIDGEARQAAGNYVDFVLWFNFSAGFFYVATGIGIWFQKIWALTVAIILAILTLLVFTAFGIHIFYGGEYEQRTVAAMSLRSSVWIVIAVKAYYIMYHAGQIKKNTK
jgi:hypothetical protein